MVTKQEKIDELKAELNARRLRWDFTDETKRRRMEILEAILCDYLERDNRGQAAEPGS